MRIVAYPMTILCTGIAADLSIYPPTGEAG